MLTESERKSDREFFVLPAQPILSILFILSKSVLDRMNRIYRIYRIYRMGSDDGCFGR
jgi:hypothetical protein